MRLRSLSMIILLIGFPSPHYGGTIAEKAASLENKADSQEGMIGLASFNYEMRQYNQQLKELYEEANRLRSLSCDDPEVWDRLRENILYLKEEIRTLQVLWAEEVATQGGDPEEYAFWSHADVTVYNLVTDYGNEQCIYIIPQEIGKIKISSVSKLIVPKEGFEDCLYLLLSRLGIGVRQIAPWMKELYVLRDNGCIAGLFSSKKDLEALPDTAHIGFVLSSKNIDVRSDFHILKRFANIDTIHIELIGGNLWLFGSAGEVQELLKIYDFIQADSVRQDYRIVSLEKIDAIEMVEILKAAFREEFKEPEDISLGLKVVPLKNQRKALFLSGSATVVNKAVLLIRELEDGIEHPSDKTVFWYNVKHSDPLELASLLSQVHDVYAGNKGDGLSVGNASTEDVSTAIHIDTSVGVNIKEGSVKYGSFIADSKTGSLIMVVEKEALPKLKMLLNKLDVPKKMVRIEVLLFERKLSHQRKSGLNLLRLGDELGKGKNTGVSWSGNGILEFLLKGATGAPLLPSYDLAYQFLMAQENVRINASPCVVTMNQTPARIAIVEEMSIAVSSEKEKAQYNRAQYGIMIKLLPVINIGEEDGKSFITMETDITFDTTGKNERERPDVTRRNITNKVRIADGETIIIGGLRCKHTSDAHNGIPFLGDLPGIGKLFGMDSTSDSQTEMFVFITPKILDNPLEQQEKQEEVILSSRPGEPEEFLQAVLCGENAVKESQKKQARLYSVELPAVCAEGLEYDGR